MKGKKLIIFIIIFYILFFVTACIPFSHHDELNPKKELKFDEISITFLGKITQFPIHTKIRLMNYAYPIISFSKKIIVPPHRVEEVRKLLGKNVFRKIEKFWEKSLRNSDFDHIARLCKKLNLFAQGQIDLPVDINVDERCVKMNGLEFYLKAQGGQENTFTISGSVLCQEKYLPAGFNKLIGEINALIPKYKPILETQFAWLSPNLK